MQYRQINLRIAVLLGLSAAIVAAGPDSAVQPTPAAFEKQYCGGCHNPKVKAGGLSLDGINFQDMSQHGDLLEKVVLKVRSGAMPPSTAPRPDKAAVNNFLVSLENSLDKAAALHPNPGRPMMLHRLNRTEYLNSVRDLLSVELNPDDAALLPADDKSFGFDNNGDVLGLSPLLLERYLSIARRVTIAALGPSTLGPDVYTRRITYEMPQSGWIDGLPFGTRGGAAFKYRFPVDGEYAIHIKLQRRYDRIIGVDQRRRPVAGETPAGPPARERVEINLDGKPVGLFAVGTDQTIRESLDLSNGDAPIVEEPYKELTREEQVQRSANADANLEVRLPIKAGEREVSAAFLAKFVPVPSQVREQFISGSAGPPRGMGIDSIIISGPFKTSPSSDTASRRKIFTCHPANEAEELPCARKILAPLAHMAWRHPVTEAETDELVTAWKEGRSDAETPGGAFEAGISMALRRMLMDPAFLFRVERDPAGVAPNAAYRLTDLELASRLSFFLWSSIPDAPLLADAEHNRLRNPAVLQAQVRRMLADARATSLVTNFASEWLSLRVIEGAKPDPIVFPEFDDGLRLAFERETEMLLETVLLGDRSVLELLNANYTFVNERLARHYGIPNVYGDQFRRVTVNDGIRGGLLGQGSILTATSYPNRTSPVVRGKWILETLLGSPPAPPPPDVPALPEPAATGRVVPMRERLSEHRKNVACAGCHSRMDPLGFALENFDATGKWRTVETNGPADTSRNPIDATGELADGTKFDGAAGLRRIMQEHSGEFVYRMTERLLTYSLGRGSDWYDAPAIRAAVRAAKKDDYKFSSILMGIVQSTPFQMRLAQDKD